MTIQKQMQKARVGTRREEFGASVYVIVIQKHSVLLLNLEPRRKFQPVSKHPIRATRELGQT